MSGQGYGVVTDSGFIGFEVELNAPDGAWGQIVTKKWEKGAEESVASLLDAPRTVEWKLRLRFGLGALIAALGAQSIGELDAAWDSAQRRLFHKIGAARDDKNPAIRAAGDRLAAGLLAGSGTFQTTYDIDAEVDFGRKQVRLTSPDGGPLAADVKKAGLESVLADIHQATEELAKAVDRQGGKKRKAPSKVLRNALGQCVSAFNAVHENLLWYIEQSPAGPDRDKLSALLAPLDALLERHTPAVATAATPESPQEPAPAPAPENKPG
jgi:hypothetical protein